MDITKTDFSILMVATILVILMTITFPAMGLADNSDTKNASDLYDDFPELSVDGDRFDFAGEFPERPGTPSGFDMIFREGEFEQQVKIIDRDGGNVVALAVVNLSAANERYGLQLQDEITPELDEGVLQGIGDTLTLETSLYSITATLEDIFFNDAQEYVETTISVEVMPQDQGSSLSWIPVLGTLYDYTEAIGGILGWIGSILYWFSRVIVTIILNLLFGLVDASIYLFSFTSIVINTMLLIVTELPPPIALFYVLPIFGMFGVLAKFLLVAVGKLPFT